MKLYGIRFFFAALLLLGCAGWFSGLVAATNNGVWPAEGSELPWGDPQGFVATSAGDLIIGSGFYQRVQVYGPTGEFKRGWQIPAGGGAFRLATTNGDEVVVATTRGHGSVFTYDIHGELLQRMSPGSEVFQKLDAVARADVHGNDGVVYRLTATAWNSQIRRRTGESTFETVATSPWRLWLLQGPLPAFLVMLLGIVGLLASFKDWVQRAGR